MPTYTVIGVWNHEGSDDTQLVVAGVVLGRVDLVDDGSEVGVGYTRFAASIEASSPSEAETLVIAEYDPAT